MALVRVCPTLAQACPGGGGGGDRVVAATAVPQALAPLSRGACRGGVEAAGARAAVPGGFGVWGYM